MNNALNPTYATPVLFYWLWRVSVDWLVIFAAMTSVYLWSQNWVIWILAIIVVGIQQHALAIMVHDGAHRLACKNPKLNDALTRLCMLPLGIRLTGYRKFHFSHHRRVGTDRDPELLHTRGIGRYLWRVPLQPHLFALNFLSFNLLLFSVPHVVSVIKLLGSRWPQCIFMIGLWVICWCVELVFIPIVWTLSLLSWFWIAFWLRVWTEHIQYEGSQITHRVTVPWYLQLIFAPHNTYMHWEHHKVPSVPCWALPQLRQQSVQPPIISLQELFKAYVLG